MKKLNLVNKEASDIEYVISKYPDGQQNIEILGWYPNTEIVILSRLNNWLDLELIICSVKSLKSVDVKQIHLFVPYFLGSRSDRQFVIGGNNYLKEVICPIINGLKFETVMTLDPHSDVLEACLNNFKKQTNHELVKWALKNINNKPDAQENTVFISPDKGAAKKIYKVLEHVNYKEDPIICSKQRDEKGKLSKFHLELGSYHDKIHDGKELNFIIIDDICDGGATFINIARELKSYFNESHKSKIYLIVTHGIFSKGFLELDKYFDGIYCTNSYYVVFV